MALFGPPDVKKLEARKNVSGLIKALGYPKDAQIRAAAASALGRIGDAEAVAPLIGALRDEGGRVSTRAREALVRIGKPAVEPLIAILQTEDLRWSAVEALGEIGDPRAAADLSGYLRDKNYHLRERVAKALTRMNWKPAQDETAAWFYIAQSDWDAVVALDGAAVAPLITVLGEDATHLRQQAAEVLGRIGDSRAAHALIAALGDADHEVRWNAAIALGSAGGAEAVEPLVAALEDGSILSSHAIDALGNIGDAHAQQALVMALRSADGRVGKEAASALARWGWRAEDAESEAWYSVAMKEWDRVTTLGSAALAPLIAFVSRHDADSASAIDALGKIGDPRAIDALVSALKVRDESFQNRLAERRAAARALVQIFGSGAATPDQKQRILEQRAFFTPHSDATRHVDQSRDTCFGTDHSDNPQFHSDSGIGVDFPL